MKPQRYLVFGGLEDHGPTGGWNDFLGSFEDISDAAYLGLKGWEKNGSKWWFQVVDLATGEEVADLEIKLEGQ